MCYSRDFGRSSRGIALQNNWDVFRQRPAFTIFHVSHVILLYVLWDLTNGVFEQIGMRPPHFCFQRGDTMVVELLLVL